MKFKKIISALLITIIFIQSYCPLALAIEENDDSKEPLIFEHEEFKNKISDCDGDGNITKYDLENVQYLFGTDYLEYPEYFTNLTTFSFNIKCTGDNYLTEQEKWVEKIKKLPNQSVKNNISFNIELDLGILAYNDEDMVINLNDYSTIINYCYGTLDKYSENIYRTDSNDTTTPFLWSDGKIIIKRDVLGSFNCGYSIYGYYNNDTDTKGYDFKIKWTTIDDGNIPNLSFENEEFKQYLINQGYDKNNDGELNKPELYNIDHLNAAPYLEKPEAFPNLKNIEFDIIYTLDNIQEKQQKIKENIDKLPTKTVKDHLYFTNTINLGSRPYSNETLSIDLKNEFSTILSYFTDIGTCSLVYESEDKSLKLNENVITINQDTMGFHSYEITMPVTKCVDGQNLTDYIHYIVKWTTVDNGNIPNLSFKNAEFKQYLIDQGYDTNGDNEINKPELQEITYLNDAPDIEYPEYFSNLQYIDIRLECSLDNALDRQEELMIQLNKIPNENCQKNYSAIYLNMENMEYNEENLNINLDQYFPSLKEINESNNKIFLDYEYQPGTRELPYNGVYDYNTVVKCDAENIIINRQCLGDHSVGIIYRLRNADEDYSSSTINFYLDWNIIDDSEIVNVPDKFLRECLFGHSPNNNYDINGDKQFSKLELETIKDINLMLVDSIVGNDNFETLEGLQYATNMETIEVRIDNGTDFSALYNLPKLKNVSFSVRKDIDMSNFYPLVKKLNQVSNIKIYTQYGKFDVPSLVSNLKDMNIDELSVNVSNIYAGETIKLSEFNEMNNIKKLNVSNLQLDEKIFGLNNLESLVITNYRNYNENEKINDFTSLNNLNKLKELEVIGNFDENLKGIDTIQNLNKLTIDNYQCPNTNTDILLNALKKLQNIDLNIRGEYNIDLGYYPINTPVTIDCMSINSLLKECLSETGMLYKQDSYAIDGTSGNKLGKDLTLKTQEFGTKKDSIVIMEKISENSYSGTTTFNINYKVTFDGDKENEVNIKEQELKEYLLDNCDIDKNNKITEFDLINIESLDLLENYNLVIDDFSDFSGMTNLKTLRVHCNNTVNLEELTQLAEITLSSSSEANVEINDVYNKIMGLINLTKVELFGEYYVNLGVVSVYSNTVINFNDICPILSGISDTNNKFYMKGASWEYRSNSDTEVIVDNNNKTVTLNTEESGNRTSTLYVKIPNGYYGNFTFANATLKINWLNAIQADTETEIDIPDINFKSTLLENYDLDKNNKITEYDLVNIEELDISNKNISDLTGIEYCENLKTIDADTNNISNLEPVRNLNKLSTIYFSVNKITDITPLSNKENLWGSLANNYITDITSLKEFKSSVNYIDLRGNYISLEEGSENLKVINELCENNSDYIGYWRDYLLKCSQKYGTPEERNDILNIKDSLKNKLIEYGIDSNNDNNITKGELNDFNQGNHESGESGLFKHFKIDLSNMELTNSDIECLKYLNCIDELDLSNNKITDASPLQYMKYLDIINLSNNDIDILTLQNVVACTIDLSHNNIKSIEGIENINYTEKLGGWMAGGGSPKYINLNLSYNDINDISSINNILFAISSLNLSNNAIEDISSLNEYEFKENESDINKDYEMKYDFSNNYIDSNSETTREIVEKFQNNNATIILENQLIKVEKTDTDTGIKIETTTDVVPENVILDIDKIDTTTDENKSLIEIIDTIPNRTENTKYQIFDIKLVNENSEQVEPNGNVTVYIPIPNEYSSMLKVYNINPTNKENPYTLLDTTIETIDNQKYVKFTTNHFSYYSIVDGFLKGDINNDGNVNMKDWNRMYEHINETNSLSNDEFVRGDINEDGIVNMKDWNRMYEHINETNPLW